MPANLQRTKQNRFELDSPRTAKFQSPKLPGSFSPLLPQSTGLAHSCSRPINPIPEPFGIELRTIKLLFPDSELYLFLPTGFHCSVHCCFLTPPGLPVALLQRKKHYSIQLTDGALLGADRTLLFVNDRVSLFISSEAF